MTGEQHVVASRAAFIPTATLFIAILATVAGTARAQLDAGNPPTAGDTEYISLTPAEFAQKAPDLLNKDVEVAGDITMPSMLSRRSVGTMADKDSGKVLVQLMAEPG